MTVNTQHSLERISDLLCCALEGGSNYWYVIDSFVAPPAMTFRSDQTEVFRHLDYPLNAGGAVIITTPEGDEIDGQTKWKLDLHACYRGLQLMAEKQPRHYGDFISENDDAETGDVFLQLALFGEVIYG